MWNTNPLSFSTHILSEVSLTSMHPPLKKIRAVVNLVQWIILHIRNIEKQWMDKPIVYLLQKYILNRRLQQQNGPVTKTTMEAIYIDHLQAYFLKLNQEIHHDGQNISLGIYHWTFISNEKPTYATSQTIVFKCYIESLLFLFWQGVKSLSLQACTFGKPWSHTFYLLWRVLNVTISWTLNFETIK